MSFRQALVWTGLVMLAALCVLALSLGATLKRANGLLDDLGRSQAQIAEAAGLQADLNAYVAGRTPVLAAQVRTDLAAYRRSIVEEGASLGAAAAEHQAMEAARAERIAQLFERIAVAEETPSADLAEFRSLIALIRTSERAEGEDSLRAMRRLREMAAGVAVAAPLVCGWLGFVGFGLMWSGVSRPLRRLEQAAEDLGRDGAAEVKPGGFAELDRLGSAFNRMAGQIAGHRQALFEANRDLEGQVLERTREIEHSRSRLADADNARRSFLSKVSHELRTPATVMRGEAEVALRDPAADAARLREALEHVAANGAFLQRRLDDLLALARADDGMLTVRREPVDLAEVGRHVAVLAESYVRSSEVTLQVNVPEGEGPLVSGDASWLQQALLALLDNAAKFAAGTTVRLSLTHEAGAAVFTVADDGPGVAKADLPRLFDRYFQTERGRDRGGAGLGLSVARWVVEQHGGEIAAHSPQGQGLSVEIRLPIAAPAKARKVRTV